VGISSSGIGSGLDVDGLVSKLMAAESAPLNIYDKKTAAYQAKLDALSKLGASLGAFQGSLSSLSTPANFRAISATASDTTVLTGSATSEAAPGSYKINVTQLAQAQSLNTAGRASMTAMLGSGATTTLTFQFGTVSGGRFGSTGSALAPGVAAGGIATGSLTINGTAIVTDGTTKSAKLLADAINAQSAKTGVSATAAATATGAALFAGFGAVDTSASGSYALSVGGVELGAQATGVAAGAGVTAASVDSALASGPTAAALSAAKITFTGTAALGTLQFFAADGSNIDISETVSGTVTGGIGHSGTANSGSSVTATSGVSLTGSGSAPITVGGSAPGLAGLTAGSGGSYQGAGFTLDGAQASGTVVLDASNQSLQGIRDAINKANIGVSASIVSDGSASPYRLVLTSGKTGASSTMKISVSGDGVAAPDPAIASLLGYDPAGTQNLNQTSAAQSTLMDVNGIPVTSASASVTGAIQGVTLDIAKLGSTNVTIAKDSSAIKSGVNAFIKAFNDLNKTIKDLTGYNPDTKKGGVLVGDSTVRSIQGQLRKQLGTEVGGVSGKLNTLSQIGIGFAKDGSLALDSSKLQQAITDNFSEIGGLFAAIGSASDSLVSFGGSTAATKPGNYALNITTLASRGTLTGAAPAAASTVIAPNTTWTVTLNQTDPATSSKVANIALTAGSYSSSELASLLRSAINGNSAFATAGDTVETEIDASGRLSLSSSRYGAVSNIALNSLSGTAVSDIFGAATPVAGTDVAGTIGGAAATGSGRTLTGGAGSPTEGLKFDVTGGAIGERGTVNFSQGYAYQLNNLAASFIGTSGLITGKADGLNVTIKAVATSRDIFSSRLVDMEKRYRAQFTKLDTALASMQSTSSYLTQQLAALAKNS
jgi:flagellar hook-associated protein 2